MAEIKALMAAVEQALAAKGLRLKAERSQFYVEIRNADGVHSSQHWAVAALLDSDTASFAQSVAENAAAEYARLAPPDPAALAAENTRLKTQLRDAQERLAAKR